MSIDDIVSEFIPHLYDTLKLDDCNDWQVTASKYIFHSELKILSYSLDILSQYFKVICEIICSFWMILPTTNDTMVCALWLWWGRSLLGNFNFYIYNLKRMMHLPCCWRRARWFNAHRSLRPFYETVSITLYVCLSVRLSVAVTRAVSANGLIVSPLDKKGNCFPTDIDKIIEITKLLCFILLCYFFWSTDHWF